MKNLDLNLTVMGTLKEFLGVNIETYAQQTTKHSLNETDSPPTEYSSLTTNVGNGEYSEERLMPSKTMSMEKHNDNRMVSPRMTKYSNECQINKSQSNKLSINTIDKVNDDRCSIPVTPSPSLVNSNDDEGNNERQKPYKVNPNTAKSKQHSRRYNMMRGSVTNDHSKMYASCTNIIAYFFQH